MVAPGHQLCPTTRAAGIAGGVRAEGLGVGQNCSLTQPALVQRLALRVGFFMGKDSFHLTSWLTWPQCTGQK